MHLTEAKKKAFEDIYQIFLNDERILKMKEIPMHRGSNCYIHSFMVAKTAIAKAIRKKNVNLKALFYAAVFHDYYLYDWRKDKSKKNARFNF